MEASRIDYGHLLRLRLAVARFGEMDLARWWNTKGMLGRMGEMALRRGFPRSHFFAQARVVFAVAADRCRRVFDPPEGVTLWKLPATVENEFDSHWPTWTESGTDWRPFFEELQAVEAIDLLAALQRLQVVSDAEADQARKLRRAADNRAVPIPGPATLGRQTLALLAAGFFRGEPGEPAIPYVRLTTP
jgi:hypothetical protein